MTSEVSMAAIAAVFLISQQHGLHSDSLGKRSVLNDGKSGPALFCITRTPAFSHCHARNTVLTAVGWGRSERIARALFWH